MKTRKSREILASRARCRQFQVVLFIEHIKLGVFLCNLSSSAKNAADVIVHFFFFLGGGALIAQLASFILSQLFAEIN